MRTRTLSTINLIVILFLFCSSCFGTDESISDALKRKFPNFNITSVVPSPVDGLYEVIAGENVIYYAPKSSHLIIGSILDSNGKDLSAEARTKIQTNKYDIFKRSIDRAIRIGSGKHEVIEVIDPDCQYCRKMAPFWRERKDVTRYVFLTALPMHKHADKKVNFILSAQNPALALEDVLSGLFDSTPLPLVTIDSKKVAAIEQVVQQAGVKGTPLYFINGQAVTGANSAQITALLR